MRPPALRALIFDVDGTLAETEELHRRAFNDTFRAYGLDWHWSRRDYAALLRIAGGKERLTHYRDEARMQSAARTFDIHAFHRDKTARYVDLVATGELALRPGIARLISAGRAAGLALAIATTTSRANVEALTHACFKRRAGDVFDVIAAGDEVRAKKPAPDVYRLALERLKIPAGAAIAFEDTKNGLDAARAAGIICIVSPSSYAKDEDFSGAAHVSTQFDQLGSLDGIAAKLPV